MLYLISINTQFLRRTMRLLWILVLGNMNLQLLQIRFHPMSSLHSQDSSFICVILFRYNKETHQMPYALTDIKKSATSTANSLQEDTVYMEVADDGLVPDDEDKEENSTDLLKDKMIKPKISKGKSTTEKKSKPTTKQKVTTAKKGASKQKDAEKYDAEGNGFVISDDEF